MKRRGFIKSLSCASAACLGLTGPRWVDHAFAAKNIEQARAFTHPGLLHSLEEIAFIKQQLHSGQKPWAQAWPAFEKASAYYLKQEPDPRPEVVRGPYNQPDIGATAFSRDASAAYTLALAWCLTKQETYAKKAVETLNGWAQTLKKIEGHDTKLLIGMMGVKYINAAELIRHTYDGWAEQDQHRFSDMLRGLFLGPINDFYPTANGNWDASMIQTMLAIGVYLDDPAIFDRAATYFRLGQGNGAITKYFNAFGQCQESGRDQIHTQMGLGFLACACEMAWKQGVDLYGEADNRLAKGFEYTAKYNLGFDVPYERYTSVQGRYDYKKISDESRGRFTPIYRSVLYHYHYRKNMDMPYTRKASEQETEGRSLRRGWAFFRWEDLMFVKPPTARE